MNTDRRTIDLVPDIPLVAFKATEEFCEDVRSINPQFPNVIGKWIVMAPRGYFSIKERYFNKCFSLLGECPYTPQGALTNVDLNIYLRK